MQTKCQVAANLQTKPTDLGCESACWLLPPTPTVAIYYSAQRLKLILPPHGGQKAELT